MASSPPQFRIFAGTVRHALDEKNRVTIPSRWRDEEIDEFYAIVNGTATGTIITIVIVFLYRAGFYSRIIFIYAGILSVAFLGLSRLIKIISLRRMRRHGIGIKQVFHPQLKFHKFIALTIFISMILCFIDDIVDLIFA